MSDCKVTAEGDFGVIEWTLSRQMYDLLPSDGRDELLALQSRLNIVRRMSLLADSIIWAASGGRPVENPPHVDFRPLERSCQFGSITWTLSSRFEAVPADYREEIYSHGESLVHDEFEYSICPSLAMFVGQYFPKYEHMHGYVYPRV